MRKLIFISFIVLGAVIGLFSALHDDWSVKVVMMTIGAVVVSVWARHLELTGPAARPSRA